MRLDLALEARGFLPSRARARDAILRGTVTVNGAPARRPHQMVGDGDTISVHCTYDNTLDNPYVQRGLAEQGLTAPVDVYLGEETLDEMCLGIFHVVYDPPAARVEDDGVLPAPPFELTRTR